MASHRTRSALVRSLVENGSADCSNSTVEKPHEWSRRNVGTRRQRPTRQSPPNHPYTQGGIQCGCRFEMRSPYRRPVSLQSSRSDGRTGRRFAPSRAGALTEQSAGEVRPFVLGLLDQPLGEVEARYVELLDGLRDLVGL